MTYFHGSRLTRRITKPSFIPSNRSLLTAVRFSGRFGYETEEGDFRVEQRLGSGQLRGIAGKRTQDGAVVDAYRSVTSYRIWTSCSRGGCPHVIKCSPYEVEPDAIVFTNNRTYTVMYCTYVLMIKLLGCTCRVTCICFEPFCFLEFRKNTTLKDKPKRVGLFCECYAVSFIWFHCIDLELSHGRKYLICSSF